RWPTSGVAIAWSTRGGTSLGPGPSRTRREKRSGFGLSGWSTTAFTRLTPLVSPSRRIDSRNHRPSAARSITAADQPVHAVGSTRSRPVQRLDQLADHLEFRAFRRLGPLEKYGLGGRDDRAGPLQAPQGELPVNFPS